MAQAGVAKCEEEKFEYKWVFHEGKGLVDSLVSIRVAIDDYDLVSVTLNGLGKEYAQFWTSIGVCEAFPNF